MKENEPFHNAVSEKVMELDQSQMNFEENLSAHAQNSSKQIMTSDFLGWKCLILLAF